MRLHDDMVEMEVAHYIEMGEIDESLTVDIAVIIGEENEYDDLYDDDSTD